VNKTRHILTAITAALTIALPVAASPAEVQKAEMAGYLLVTADNVPDAYNAGFSLYTAAWPLLRQYPGHRFQTGLFGTWIHAQYEGRPPTNLYSDIEGGLGWWHDTRFPTETPKFIMGGVAVNFKEIANGLAHGRGTWDKPRGLYGVAQLSPWLLFPIDGLNVKQGTCGDLFSGKQTQALFLKLAGGIACQRLHAWQSTARKQFLQLPDVPVVDGTFSLKVEPAAIYSLTTTDGQQKAVTEIPPSRPLPLPYRDDSDSYRINETPKYLSDCFGAFQVKAGGRSGNCLRQVITQRGDSWPACRLQDSIEDRGGLQTRSKKL